MKITGRLIYQRENGSDANSINESQAAKLPCDFTERLPATSRPRVWVSGGLTCPYPTSQFHLDYPDFI